MKIRTMRVCESPRYVYEIWICRWGKRQNNGIFCQQMLISSSSFMCFHTIMIVDASHAVSSELRLNIKDKTLFASSSKWRLTASDICCARTHIIALMLCCWIKRALLVCFIVTAWKLWNSLHVALNTSNFLSELKQWSYVKTFFIVKCRIEFLWHWLGLAYSHESFKKLKFIFCLHLNWANEISTARMKLEFYRHSLYSVDGFHIYAKEAFQRIQKR